MDYIYTCLLSLQDSPIAWGVFCFAYNVEDHSWKQATIGPLDLSCITLLQEKWSLCFSTIVYAKSTRKQCAIFSSPNVLDSYIICIICQWLVIYTNQHTLHMIIQMTSMIAPGTVLFAQPNVYIHEIASANCGVLISYDYHVLRSLSTEHSYAMGRFNIQQYIYSCASEQSKFYYL